MESAFKTNWVYFSYVFHVYNYCFKCVLSSMNVSKLILSVLFLCFFKLIKHALFYSIFECHSYCIFDICLLVSAIEYFCWFSASFLVLTSVLKCLTVESLIWYSFIWMNSYMHEIDSILTHIRFIPAFGPLLNLLFSNNFVFKIK